MQKPWRAGHRALLETLLVSVVLASLAVASAQPSNTNSTAPNTQPRTNMGVGATNAAGPRKTNPWEISKSINAVDLAALQSRVGQEDAQAQFELGLRYDKGYGVTRDPAKALELFKRSADNGHPTAQVEMAYKYRSGDGVKKDLGESLTYLRKAADQGDYMALGELGRAYRDGEGVTQDLERAEALYWQAYARDKPWGEVELFVLADNYSKGSGVAKNTPKAIEIYKKLISGGQMVWADELVRIYETGDGVPKDLREAERWKNVSAERDRKWAEQGEAPDQASLGQDYLNGYGVVRDDFKASQWLRRAANQGDPQGQLLLGICYENGRGVPQDFAEAYKWFNLAASANAYSPSLQDLVERASALRTALVQKMTPEQIAEAQHQSSRFAAKKEPSNNSTDLKPGETTTDESTPRASGTVFFVTEDGYLLTSWHVVEDASRIMVKTKQGVLQARLVKADKANDVAILKAVGKFAALPVAPSRGARLGETVFTVGFPNPELQGFSPKITKGEISSLTGVQDDPREFQISVAVQPGNSGGPLVNQYGNVVGIVEARLADIATLKSTGSLPQNVNYAVKSSVLSVLLESLPEISSKLKEPYPAKERKFEDVVKETESATALVLVY